MKIMYKATEEDPNLGDYYVRMGENTVEATRTWSRTITTGAGTQTTSGATQALTVK